MFKNKLLNIAHYPFLRGMLKRILPRYTSDLTETAVDQIQKKIDSVSQYINQILDNVIVVEEPAYCSTKITDYDDFIDQESGIKPVPKIQIDLSDEALKKQEEDLKYELKEIKILE